ncbi:sigma-54-dependent Fis family transcriptional regulator [bacterium]|nr:sigma-54-dependent Fis family transcriptional regulator [candidate division CSSED10-310 bacterium]
MKSFKVHIVANSRQKEMLVQALKPIKPLRVVHHGDLVEQKGFPADNCDELCLIWIDDYTARNRRALLHDPKWIAHKNTIILVGEKIHPSTAIQLGSLGYSNFFALPDEKENLLDNIMQFIPRTAASNSDITAVPDLDDMLIGTSVPVTSLKSLIRKIAPRDKLMVLVRGETGTGKGLVAKMLHQMSPRSEKPFIEINCTAIPDSLVEAELFGHERGAFTDAHKSRRGIFEMSHGGTLFLDEVGYLRPEIQVKLLKVLEDKRFRRVGGEADIQVDCRIIVGTSVNLEEKVTKGEFREDLYYRLNVFPVWVPPLRERGQDVVRLAEHFRNFYSREHGISTAGFTERAIRCLISGAWHGNIRELKHCIERAVILSEDRTINEDDLGCHADLGLVPDNRMDEEDGPSGHGGGFQIMIGIPEHGKSMDDIQRDVIECVLEKTEGNRSEAARLLGISRSRLLRRINTDHTEE